MGAHCIGEGLALLGVRGQNHNGHGSVLLLDSGAGLHHGLGVEADVDLPEGERERERKKGGGEVGLSVCDGI